MKRITLPLAIFFCFLALCAPRVSAKDDWISVRSKNFLLIGNARQKQIRQVAGRLEQFREVFTHLFPKAVIGTPVPTTVVVFKNDSSYRPFKPNASTAGYFQSGEDVNYITLTLDANRPQDSFEIIFHEYTHLMVRETLGTVPTWFSEGLAEYYSTFRISDDQKVVLGNPIPSHIYLLRERRLLPLRTLFQVDQKSPYYNEREKQSIFYAESWALLHYLILGKDGARANQVGAFIEALGRNVPVDEAFQQTFSMTFESMEKELQDYVKNDRYPIVTRQLSRKLASEIEMEVAALSEAQTQAYLGDLLLHSNRADAEVYLKKALELDPDLAMAHASMGILRVREGKADEALRSLEKAVAADSQNYLIHYYYAFALSRSGQDSSGLVSSFPPEHVGKMRASLEKAIALRPDYVESISLLAFVNLVTETRVDESIDMLQKARARASGQNDLMFMLAQLYISKHDYDAAKNVISKINTTNSQPEVVTRAQSLLKQIATLEELEADIRNTRRNSIGDDTPPTQVSERTELGPVDLSAYLRAALRKPAIGDTQTQGVLQRVDCDAKGMTFVIKLPERVIKLRASTFKDVRLRSFSEDSGREITCGVRKPATNVVVNYTASADARSQVDGLARSLEFVPPDFNLRP